MALSAALLLVALGAVGLALALSTTALWKPDPRFHKLQMGCAVLGLGFQMVSLALLAFELGRAPLAGQSAGLSFTAWALLLGYLVLQWKSRVPVLGAFVLPMVAGLDLAALLVWRSQPVLPPGQQLKWLAVHASLSFLGLAVFGVVSALAAMYLVQERSIKRHRASRIADLLPSLDRLDRWIYQALAIGFPLLTLGILTGVFWMISRSSEHALPLSKTVFPVMAWSIYALVLWARVMAGWRGRKLAWVALIGFSLALLTFLGIGG